MAKPDKEPPEISLLVGGPFDGHAQYFNPKNWIPDEVRYRKYYEQGIIEDVTMLSKKFPEGAVYRWNGDKGYWEYIGIPSRESQENFRELLDAFDVEPEEPL